MLRLASVAFIPVMVIIVKGEEIRLRVKQDDGGNRRWCDCSHGTLHETGFGIIVAPDQLGCN